MRLISRQVAEVPLPHYEKHHFALIGQLAPVRLTVRGVSSVRMDLMCYAGKEGSCWGRGGGHNVTN